MTAIRIYTDGSVSNNGQQNPKGGIGAYFTKNHQELFKLSEYYEYNDEITNNTCELYAILRVFEILIENNYHKEYSIIELYSDSKYSVSSLTEWILKWKINGWKGSSGPVKNKELIQEIHKLHTIILKTCNLEIIHTKNFNHRIPPKNCTNYIWIGNHRADELATIGRKMSK